MSEFKGGDVRNAETEPRSGKGSPPSTQRSSILRAVGFKSRRVTRWAGINKPELSGCKTWIHLLCCLCKLLWFDSSQQFPRTLFSSMLVWKRILTFSHLCWVDNRAAFTLDAWSALKQVGDAPKTPQEVVKIPSPKQESKVVSTVCYYIYSIVQTHVVTAPQRMRYPVYILSPKQANIDSTVTNYLPEKQIRIYKNVQKFIEWRFSLFCF